MAGTAPIREPIVGKDGRLSPVWARYFTRTLDAKWLEQLGTNLTNGSVIFVDGKHASGDSNNLFWDTTLKTLVANLIETDGVVVGSTLSIESGSISDSTGTIDFDDSTLTTTGEMKSRGFDLLGNYSVTWRDALNAVVAEIIYTGTLQIANPTGDIMLNPVATGIISLMRDTIIASGEKLGIGEATPTALIHLAAGTATVPQIKANDGVTQTTPAAGEMNFHGDRWRITNVGIERVIDRTSDILIADVEVVDTIAEETIYTGYIGADALRVNNILKLHCDGVISTATGADDITIRVYLGLVEVLAFNPAIGNVAGEHWHIKGEMTVRTIGAAGTMAYHLDASIAGFTFGESGKGNTNTTIAEDFTVTVEWDNAKAGNTITIHQGSTEWKG